MKISGERLLSDLKRLKTFTDTPGTGVTRFSYGENDKKVREYLDREAKSFGFSVRTDAIGNMLIGESEEKKEGKKIYIGSHIDTVRNGGGLDGIYGVVSGLEILRTLRDNNSSLAADVRVVIFAEEEGSNFGSTMTGSKFITGIYGKEDLDHLKNEEEISLREILVKFGCPPYRQEEVSWDYSRIKAMLEIHIEQGPVLEQEGKTIGIVDAIFGMTTIEVTISGTGNHAGATPMRYRQDALAAAARCIAEAERIAAADSEGITVATVGKVAVSPNCSNVIPEKVVFTVEVRDKCQKKIDETRTKIEERTTEICRERGVGCKILKLAESGPFRMEASLLRHMDQLAEAADIPHRIMDSGAVHDTCVIAPYIPSGMLFVPSKGGRSHVPFEDTDPEDLVRGTQLLLDTVLSL